MRGARRWHQPHAVFPLAKNKRRESACFRTVQLCGALFQLFPLLRSSNAWNSGRKKLNKHGLARLGTGRQRLIVLGWGESDSLYGTHVGARRMWVGDGALKKHPR